ncbi:MAG TPA: diguanylate cyclase [Tepidisphaeraceae bacterium]|nr:diguanylate cyclase [Tepidisphaeraceae bacterium]
MGTATVKALRLLIIEDDVDQRELIREQVEDRFGRGTVVGVESRTEALKHDLGSFDLILTDFNLPDGTGMDVLREVAARCTTPVIMVTGENVGETAAEAIRQGATDYVVKVGDYLFTIPLVIEKNLTVAKIIREREELRKQLEEKNAQLEQMAATDALTGVYNRRHFGRVLEQLFAEAQRYDKDLAAVMIDLDGYKQLNDTFGHQLGDQLLVMAGRVISANMRRMDVAARYGGDEFVLLLPQASTEDAALAAGRIREEFFAASAALLRRNQGVTMSIGIASLKLCGAGTPDQLVNNADQALYKSKQGGRNRISVGNPSTNIVIPDPAPAPSGPAVPAPAVVPASAALAALVAAPAVGH